MEVFVTPCGMILPAAVHPTQQGSAVRKSDGVNCLHVHPLPYVKHTVRALTVSVCVCVFGVHVCACTFVSTAVHL